jgi:hypothetical protein
MKKISRVTMGMDKVSNTPIIFLQVENTNTVVPIWIGPCEAGVIALLLRNEVFERPLTHDLIGNSIKELGAKPLEVLIDEFKKDIYYAKLVIEKNDSQIVYIDARPSDCIIISLKNNIPIFIDENIVNEHGIDSSFIEDENEEHIKKDIENFDIDELRKRFEGKNKKGDD